MSRSYRLRHLPKIPGTAHRFAQGIGYKKTLQDPVEEEIWRVVAHEILGLPCLVNKDRPSKSLIGYHTPHEDCCWAASGYTLYRSLYKSVKGGYMQPILPIFFHPYVGCWSGAESNIKKWYRTQSHQTARSRAKQMLKNPNTDWDDARLPISEDFFSLWDIT